MEAAAAAVGYDQREGGRIVELVRERLLLLKLLELLSCKATRMVVCVFMCRCVCVFVCDGTR